MITQIAVEGHEILNQGVLGQVATNMQLVGEGQNNRNQGGERGTSVYGQAATNTQLVGEG